MEIYSPSGIKAILSKHRYFLSSNRGQNYLVNKNIAYKIAEKVKSLVPKNTDLKILEVGSGLGAITIPLAEISKKVLAVEIDKGISECFIEAINFYKLGSKVKVINKDFLKISPNDISEFNNKDTVFVSNLPYNVCGEILKKVINEFKIEHIFVMVQKEFFERITSQSGSEKYSALSVIFQLSTEVIKKLLEVNRNNFFPIPSIDSVFLYIKKNNEVTDENVTEVIQKLFSARRKNIVNSIRNLVELDKTKIESILRDLSVNGNLRIEDLPPNTIKILAEKILSI